MTTRSFPGCFGSLQGFLKGLAVVSDHIGGEDNPGYGQREAQEEITELMPTMKGLRLFLPGKDTTIGNQINRKRLSL